MNFRTLFLLVMLIYTGQGLAQIAVRSDLSADFDVRAGEVVDGLIVLENTGNSEATVHIYQTDYLFQADGSNLFGEPGSNSRSNAAWVTTETATLALAAGQRTELRYRIDVPDEDLTGSYWSVIMIEESVPSTAPEAEGVAIVTVMRYAVQVVTTFGSSGEAELQFVEPTLKGNQTSGHTFEIDLVNTGERMLQSDYYLELYDQAGAQVARVEGSPGRTYPGTSLSRRFPLGHLEPGPYTAIVVADAGGDDLFGAQYLLTVRE